MGLFESVTVRGLEGVILWNGIRTAAVVTSWTITKSKKVWTLRAAVSRADPFALRQRPLMFTAPRAKAGFWSWPIKTVDAHVGATVSATLGPPEY